MSEIIILGSTSSGKTSLVIATAYLYKKKLTTTQKNNQLDTQFEFYLPDLSMLAQPEPSSRHSDLVENVGSSEYTADEMQQDVSVKKMNYSPDDLHTYFVQIPGTPIQSSIPFVMQASGNCKYRDVRGNLQDLPGKLTESMDDEEYESYMDKLLASASAIMVVLDMGKIRRSETKQGIKRNQALIATIRLLNHLSMPTYDRAMIALCLTKPDTSAAIGTFRTSPVRWLLENPEVTHPELKTAIWSLRSRHKDRVSVFKTFSYGYCIDQVNPNVKQQSVAESVDGKIQFEFIEPENWAPYRVDEPFRWIYSKLTEQRLEAESIGGILSDLLLPLGRRLEIFRSKGCLFEMPEDLRLDDF